MPGHSPFMSKLMSLVIDMDRMVGKDFETNLEKLKVAARSCGSVPSPLRCDDQVADTAPCPPRANPNTTIEHLAPGIHSHYAIAITSVPPAQNDGDKAHPNTRNPLICHDPCGNRKRRNITPRP